MKSLAHAISIATLGCTLSLSAQTTETEKTTETKHNGDGSVSTTETTTTTFNPAARTKVVKYFETYKSNPQGLPPEWVAKIRVKELPRAWRTRINPGMVIEEKERGYLVEAPPELVEVLPPSTGGVRYYVAGGNVVAVDSSYKIVDSIAIPTVKFDVD